MEPSAIVVDSDLRRSSSWHWHLEPGRAASLAPIIDRWDGLESWPGASVLKSNPLRTVIALPPENDRPALIVKRYHVKEGRERLKYLLFPSRAKREWRALRRLRRAGVAVPEPYGYGEEREGRSLLRAGLLMERIGDATPLPRWLAQNLSLERRGEVLRRVGCEIARLHDAGADHSDLHAGNVLVRGSGLGETPAVSLIDHHAIRSYPWIPGLRRVSNLARFVHSLGGALTRQEWMLFLIGYEEARRGRRWGRDRLPRILERLAARAQRLELVRLRSRSRRCWVTSSTFVREESPGLVVYRRREIEFASLLPLLSDDLELAPIFKERPGYRVGATAIAGPAGAIRVAVKVHDERSLARRVLQRILGGPLERAWGAARALDVREIPNPRALALMIVLEGGLPARSVLVTELVAEAMPLHADLMRRYWPPPGGDRRPLVLRIDRLAEIVRRLHDTGIYHRDLNPMNILVAPRADGNGEALALVDLDSVALRRRLTLRRRRKNLVQLGLLPEGHIRRSERLRFLRAYDRGEGRYWRHDFVAALDRELAEETVRIISRLSRDEAHAENGDPRFRTNAPP